MFLKAQGRGDNLPSFTSAIVPAIVPVIVHTDILAKNIARVKREELIIYHHDPLKQAQER